MTSKDNPEIKNLRKLFASKRERDRQSLFVCEGTRLCLDGLKSGRIPEALYVTKEALVKYPSLLDIAGQAANAIMIPESLAELLADTKSSQGVFAVFKKLDILKCPVKIKNGRASRHILLSSIQDPGNIGTILRTGEAFGIDGAILSADCADPYSPKALRAGMGAIFRLPVAVDADLTTEIDSLRSQSVKVYAAALKKNAISVIDCDFSGHSAILIGNEGNGLPENLIETCTSAVIIPMAGGAESLNAATAAQILIWEQSHRLEAGHKALRDL